MDKVKLVVRIDGGLVQDIISNVPAEVLILDQDVEGCDETKRIKEWDFKNKAPSEETFEVYDREPWNVYVAPGGVDHFFNEMARKENEPKD